MSQVVQCLASNKMNSFTLYNDLACSLLATESSVWFIFTLQNLFMASLFFLSKMAVNNPVLNGCNFEWNFTEIDHLNYADYIHSVELLRRCGHVRAFACNPGNSLFRLLFKTH